MKKKENIRQIDHCRDCHWWEPEHNLIFGLCYVSPPTIVATAMGIESELPQTEGEGTCQHWLCKYKTMGK